MTEVPDGWKKARLGDLGRYINGRGFKKSEWSTSGRPIIRIQNLTGSSDTFNYFDGEVEDRHIVRPGDLLISWAATLGAYFWTGPEGLLNQHIFRVESWIEPRFHKYLLDSKLAELYSQTHGSGMVHITRGKFDAIEVLLPPRDEQRKIVEILEDHFSRLDAADELLRRARIRAERMLASVKDSLVWAGGAKAVPVGELLREKMRNGHSARAVQGDGDGIRTLTLTAVTLNSFTDNYTKITTADPERVADLWLKSGDILVQRANTPELVGTSAIYEGAEDWAIYPDLLIRLRVDEGQARPHYVALALAAERTHRALRSRAKGLAGSMPKVDQNAIATTRIPLPSLEEQDRIVQEVGAMQSNTTVLLQEIERAARRSQNLRRALLTAAFNGKLTESVSNVERVEEMDDV